MTVTLPLNEPHFQTETAVASEPLEKIETFKMSEPQYYDRNIL